MNDFLNSMLESRTRVLENYVEKILYAYKTKGEAYSSLVKALLQGATIPKETKGYIWNIEEDCKKSS